jgi:hypothetical protein
MRTLSLYSLFFFSKFNVLIFLLLCNKVHLYRPAPTVDDLSLTAEGMVKSANLKGYLQALARAYNSVYHIQGLCSVLVLFVFILQTSLSFIFLHSTYLT